MPFDMQYRDHLYGDRRNIALELELESVRKHIVLDTLSIYPTQQDQCSALAEPKSVDEMRKAECQKIEDMLRHEITVLNSEKKLNRIWCDRFNKRNDLQYRRHMEAIQNRIDAEQQHIIQDERRQDQCCASCNMLRSYGMRVQCKCDVRCKCDVP